MAYDGNPALSSEIQQRILTTYRQTQELAAKGNSQEARLGCDFILRMDPKFRPARELLWALDAGGPVPIAADPTGGDGTVRMPTAAPPPRLPVPASSAPSPVPSAGGSVLEAALADLLAKRELRRLVQAAEENRSEVAQNPALRKLVETAYARLEAEPYIKNYLDSARTALGIGDFEECDRLLTKARSLDPTAPGIEEVAFERQQYESPADVFGSAVPAFLTRPRAGVPSADFDTDPEVVRHDIPPESMAPSFGGSGSGDGRIQELLEDGQKAFDRGEYQEAIDCWSRIFLIDIDHEEAARRIEEARRQRAEAERKVEEVFHEGVAAFEAGELEKARRSFQRVLSIAPGYLAAREYLDQLNGGEVGNELAPLDEGFETAGPAPLKQEALVPPVPSAAAARPVIARPRVTVSPTGGKPPAAKRGGGSHKSFLLIGGAALALILAISGFVWMKRDQFFPNFGAKAVRQGPDPLVRAKKQYQAGKLEGAIQLLKEVPADDPSYTEAKTLITAWELELKQKASAAAEAQAQANPELAQRRERLLARARSSMEEGENYLADAYFRAVSQDAALSPTDQQMAVEAAIRLEPLQRELDLIRQQEWNLALPSLWKLREAEPSNRDVQRLIFNCYYNLAVRDLQGGNTSSAVKWLDQALKIRPSESGVERIRDFARTYANRPRDLLYRIYVNHLPTL